MDLKLLKKELIRDEGISLKPYKDTIGKLTIGIGRNLSDKGITAEEAYYLLDNDIHEVIAYLEQTYAWFPLISEVRQRVLVNMAFNMGPRKLSAFRNTLACIARAEYDEASKEMLKSRWATQVGARATRLSEMMRTGQEVS